MKIETINPANGTLIKTYDCMSDQEVSGLIDVAHCAFLQWRKKSFKERGDCMLQVAKRLRDDSEQFAKLITTEMGKPIAQARAEIEKCAWICEYYAIEAENYLQPNPIETGRSKSYVCYQPKGVIYAIMPWNYPFWQVFRFAAPNLMAGNVGVLSHAPISTGAALAIENIFLSAGCSKGIFTSLIMDVSQSPRVIAHKHITGITLTGSGRAGKAVAADAAKELKKTVLELGGSDPYIVLADADVKAAAKICVDDRMMVSGQVCISAKRLIVVDAIYDAFLAQVKTELARYQAGNPMDENCNFGPLARADLRDQVVRQVDASIKEGARCLMGGKAIPGNGFYYQPTLLVDVTPDMTACKEELFGPVVCVMRAKDEADAIRMGNDTQYGLGAAVFTQDVARGEQIAAEQLDAGVCAVNSIVASDPRLPFGGTKASGYGRECATEGIREFMNIKTVMVK